MKEMLCSSTFFGVMITLIGYELGFFLKRKYKLAIFNPIMISILFIMSVIWFLKVDYPIYSASTKQLSYLLAPATVCLAIPLYEQLELLKRNINAILIGITFGVVTNAVSIFLLITLFNLDYTQYITLIPKSTTVALAIGISEKLGGIVTITIASVMVTGIVGNIFAEPILKFFEITEPVAKGIAIGTSAHTIGTVKALEIGEIEGAMSSLSIIVAGLITVFSSVLLSVLIH